MRLTWRSWLAIVYSIAFSVVLLYLGWVGSEFNKEFWSTLIPGIPVFPQAVHLELPVARMTLQSIGIVIILVALSLLTARLDPKFNAKRLVGANMNFRPLFHPWVRYPFAALFIWNLPILATLEEFVFRHGGFGWHGPIVTWQDVVVRSLVFGLAHALMSWNLRGGIVQTVLSFWFSYQYLSGGADPLTYASFSHFLVDLLALTPPILQLCLRPHVRTVVP